MQTFDALKRRLTAELAGTWRLLKLAAVLAVLAATMQAGEWLWSVLR